MPKLWCAALLAAFLVGCSPVAPLRPGPTAPAAPLLGPAPPVRLGADDMTLLRSGPATFARLRLLLDSAQTAVHLEMYEFNHPQLVGAVLAAHGRGVRVTVIDDPSEVSSAATAARLRGAGLDVVDYPVRRLMIDHVKLLVVDSMVAVVGGINWGVRSPANHDYDALVRGPVVSNLDRVFLRDLVTSGRRVAIPDAVTDPSVTVAATLPGAEVRPLALQLINGATRTLDLELFVLTDTAIVQALQDAERRGVRIRVLLDPSQHPSDPSYRTLIASGVAVRWYRSRGELLHAKAIVADASAVLFGSANWSGGGFDRNHELDVELLDAPPVATAMQAQMQLDWAASG